MSSSDSLIDLSLDDIIKLNKKKKLQQQRRNKLNYDFRNQNNYWSPEYYSTEFVQNRVRRAKKFLRKRKAFNRNGSNFNLVSNPRATLVKNNIFRNRGKFVVMHHARISDNQSQQRNQFFNRNFNGVQKQRRALNTRGSFELLTVSFRNDLAYAKNLNSGQMKRVSSKNNTYI